MTLRTWDENFITVIPTIRTLTYCILLINLCSKSRRKKRLKQSRLWNSMSNLYRIQSAKKGQTRKLFDLESLLLLLFVIDAASTTTPAFPFKRKQIKVLEHVYSWKNWIIILRWKNWIKYHV